MWCEQCSVSPQSSLLTQNPDIYRSSPATLTRRERSPPGLRPLHSFTLHCQLPIHQTPRIITTSCKFLLNLSFHEAWSLLMHRTYRCQTQVLEVWETDFWAFTLSPLASLSQRCILSWVIDKPEWQHTALFFQWLRFLYWTNLCTPCLSSLQGDVSTQPPSFWSVPPVSQTCPGRSYCWTQFSSSWIAVCSFPLV